MAPEDAHAATVSGSSSSSAGAVARILDEALDGADSNWLRVTTGSSRGRRREDHAHLI
jgi:hypothetical protein